jgi:hypothetical protein
VILVTYLLYGYPEGVRISRLVDPLVVSILKGGVVDPYLMVATASQVDKYKQEDERSSFLSAVDKASTTAYENCVDCPTE